MVYCKISKISAHAYNKISVCNMRLFSICAYTFGYICIYFRYALIMRHKVINKNGCIKMANIITPIFKYSCNNGKICAYKVLYLVTAEMCAYKIMLFSGKKNMRLYSVCADILICAYFRSFTVFKKLAGWFIYYYFIY